MMEPEQKLKTGKIVVQETLRPAPSQGHIFTDGATPSAHLYTLVGRCYAFPGRVPHARTVAMDLGLSGHGGRLELGVSQADLAYP